jgi:hypothetical protein
MITQLVRYAPKRQSRLRSLASEVGSVWASPVIMYAGHHVHRPMDRSKPPATRRRTCPTRASASPGAGAATVSQNFPIHRF